MGAPISNPEVVLIQTYLDENGPTPLNVVIAELSPKVSPGRAFRFWVRTHPDNRVRPDHGEMVHAGTRGLLWKAIHTSVKYNRLRRWTEGDVEMLAIFQAAPDYQRIQILAQRTQIDNTITAFRQTLHELGHTALCRWGDFGQEVYILHMCNHEDHVND
jgi:hypothetical protein